MKKFENKKNDREKNSQKLFDCVVIGGGPAGIAAAIQLKRSGAEVVLVEKNRLGGSLWNANLIENYLGFPEGIRGKELVGLFIKQFENNCIKTIFSDVKLIEKKKKSFEITLADDSEDAVNNLFSRTVIIATGLKPKKLGLKEEQKLHAEGRLFYEIREISSDVRNKRIVIIGGGDAAFDYALNLTDRENKCSILCRNNSKCLDILRQRASNNNNITVLQGVRVREIRHYDDTLNIMCDNKKVVEADYVLIAIGKKSDLALFNGLIQTNQKKNENKGIFIAGDAQRAQFRQLCIAIGDGLLAAMRVKEFLGEKK